MYHRVSIHSSSTMGIIVHTSLHNLRKLRKFGTSLGKNGITTLMKCLQMQVVVEKLNKFFFFSQTNCYCCGDSELLLSLFDAAPLVIYCTYMHKY